MGRVLHHRINLGLGKSFRKGQKRRQGSLDWEYTYTILPTGSWILSLPIQIRIVSEVVLDEKNRPRDPQRCICHSIGVPCLGIGIECSAV